MSWELAAQPASRPGPRAGRPPLDTACPPHPESGPRASSTVRGCRRVWGSQCFVRSALPLGQVPSSRRTISQPKRMTNGNSMSEIMDIVPAKLEKAL